VNWDFVAHWTMWFFTPLEMILHLFSLLPPERENYLLPEFKSCYCRYFITKFVHLMTWNCNVVLYSKARLKIETKLCNWIFIKSYIIICLNPSLGQNTYCSFRRWR
jgi:hypothetical protein